MANIVDAVLEHRADKRPAIVADGASTSYQELVELIGRLAGGLTRHVTAGQGVCLLVSHPGLVESLALTLAGWSLGLRVAVVPTFLTARERDGVVAHCRPVVSVSAETPDSADSLAFATLVDGPVSRPSTAADAWLETFTSGTTGRSKCVDRRVSRLSSDIEQLVSATGLTAADTVTATATALSTTSVLPALCAGATIATITLRSPRQFWQALGERSVTVLSGMPYIYEFAVRSRPDMAQLAGLRLALTTSARLRPMTARQIMRDTGVPVRNILCSSEAGHIAYNDADDRDVLARSVGRPLAGVEVEIRGADGRAVPVGQAGRICVRSPYTATGYRGQPDATGKVFQGDWIVSTDLGFVDPQGYLHLTGREDHKIHFGAAKIDPVELEDLLLEHPAVDDVLVIGEDHVRLGQVPVARVVASNATAAELLAFCRERVSATKAPQRIEFVDHIEKDPNDQPVRAEPVRFD